MTCEGETSLFSLFCLLGEIQGKSCFSEGDVKTLSGVLNRINPSSGSNPIDALLREQVCIRLSHLQRALSCLITAQECLSICAAANEPFRRVRRRLPPQAEDDLSIWLKLNADHPYMPDELIEEYAREYGVESEQIRVFLTNSRRKMEGGVRKRQKRA